MIVPVEASMIQALSADRDSESESVSAARTFRGRSAVLVSMLMNSSKATIFLKCTKYINRFLDQFVTVYEEMGENMTGERQ
jgi:hypothetical protein